VIFNNIVSILGCTKIFKYSSIERGRNTKFGKIYG